MGEKSGIKATEARWSEVQSKANYVHEEEIKYLKSRLNRYQMALAFATNVVKCGEPWTSETQKIMDTILDAS